MRGRPKQDPLLCRAIRGVIPRSGPPSAGPSGVSSPTVGPPLQGHPGCHPPRWAPLCRAIRGVIPRSGPPLCRAIWGVIPRGGLPSAGPSGGVPVLAQPGAPVPLVPQSAPPTPPRPTWPGRLVDELSRSATLPKETYKWTCDKIIKSCYFSPDSVLLNTLTILSPSFSLQTWVLQALCACSNDESESRSVVSDSLRPRELHSPWNSSGQNTGVGSLSLLQGTFPTQELNQGLPHCRWILYQLSHQGR